MSEPIALVIFDCDGVLVDSESLAFRAVAEELAPHGLTLAPLEAAARFAGYTDRDIARVVAAETGRALPDDFPARLQARAMALFEAELVAVPGAADALAAIALPRCVASNSPPERIERALRLVGLRDHFPAEGLFSADHVARPKPAPDLHRHVAQRMGAPAEACVVIEDSPTGVAAARAAGMAVIGFTGASHIPPGHARTLMEAGTGKVIDDLRRLPGLLKRDPVGP
jgi:HAD superfamily hydrolase (TIGR01509 family)